jgi:hypothetical protein
MFSPLKISSYLYSAELQRFMAPKNTDNTSPSSQWNTLAQEVGCGTGMCLGIIFVSGPRALSAGDAMQLVCMKAVPAQILENAVMASNLGFSMVADGRIFRLPLCL